MKPYRFLGIAPYESMNLSMLRVSREYDQIDLTVYTGDLGAGAQIARRHRDENYDAIISRGGTAQMIEAVSKVPVIEIETSVYDILRAIRAVKSFTSSYAIVGFPGITKSASLLCDLLHYDVPVITLHEEEDVAPALSLVKEQGISTIVCDMIASTKAKQTGLNAILITSGVESIKRAMEQAIRICSGQRALREENSFLRRILKESGEGTLVFDEDGSVFFSSVEGDDEAVLRAMRHDLSSIPDQEESKFFRKIRDHLYSVNASRVEYDQKNYTVFHFTDTAVPVISSKYGIQYLNREEVEDIYLNSFFSISGSPSLLEPAIGKVSQTSGPVMILGENGSGHSHTAGTLYLHSGYDLNPLITADFSLLSDKSWNFLTNHYNSPLNDSSNTIFFRNLQELTQERLRRLLSLIIDMNVAGRNRLIFSCSYGMDEYISEGVQQYIDSLSCLTIHLPELRSRRADIPVIANLYLNTLNVELGKEIFGFEEEATALLREYEWPGNYSQFKRFLTELVVLTDTSYITAAGTAQRLEEERKAQKRELISKRPAAGLDLSRPLSEINRDIAEAVLVQTGGNQSETARRLQISRTTLWRMLRFQ